MRTTGFRGPTAIIAFWCLGRLWSQSSEPSPYWNAALPAAQRAADLVPRMTVEEEVSQLVDQSRAVPRILASGSFEASSAISLAAQSQQAPSRTILVNLKDTTGKVDRFFDLSVGSDYPGTLIRDDSQAQLKLTVDELGFRYIRFHAIFHDVLGTVRIEDGKTVYNWSKIDQLYDDLLARHIRPFVELGFTPKALATSQNSIFYWNGNTSHPKPEGWHDLVDAFIRHIEERYGKDEVRTWFFEVWNEPNLSGFWEGGDQKAYFELYDLTAKTIKSIDPALRVGGPSTAGAAWVPEFLAHVKQSGAAVDFVTTHTYGVEGGFLDEKGESDTKLDPHRPTRLSATCGVCASRFRLRRFPGFRCTLPSGAQVIRRATRCTIPISARPTS